MIDFTTKDPKSGVPLFIIEDFETKFPHLKDSNGRFRVASMRMDGALLYWVHHVTPKWEIYSAMTEEITYEDIPLLSRMMALRAMWIGRGRGLFYQLFDAESDIRDQFDRAKIALQYKTYKSMTTLISEMGMFTKDGVNLTPDEIWDGLPKHPIPKLGQLFAEAMSLKLQRDKGVSHV